MENKTPNFNAVKTKQPQKVLKLHNTPDFYRDYTKKWADSIEKPVEKAIMQDIAALVEIACQHLTPTPQQTDPANNKNQK